MRDRATMPSAASFAVCVLCCCERSALFTLFILQPLIFDTDHPFINSANTDRQRLGNIPHFRLWMSCQVHLHSLIVVCLLFLVTGRRSLLSRIYLAFALGRGQCLQRLWLL